MNDLSHIGGAGTRNIWGPFEPLQAEQSSGEELEGTAGVAFQRSRRDSFFDDPRPIIQDRAHDSVVFGETVRDRFQPPDRFAAAPLEERRRQTEIYEKRV